MQADDLNDIESKLSRIIELLEDQQSINQWFYERAHMQEQEKQATNEFLIERLRKQKEAPQEKCTDDLQELIKELESGSPIDPQPFC